MTERFMKKPCKNCPFRNDVTPYLHPERADEIANSALNPYADFACHETTEHYEDGPFEGEAYQTEKSRTCHGFLTIRAQAGEEIPEGFEPQWSLCYVDEYEMYQAYEEEWERQGRSL